MALSLPNTLVAGTNENVNHVQANFDTIANSFPLAANSTNFSTVPQCRVTHNTTQSITAGAVTAIAFNAETYDLGTPSNNMHDTSSNNSRITCRVAGLYAISGMLNFNGTATGQYFILSIRLNNTTDIAETNWTSNAVSGPRAEVSTQYRLAVNDYVELRLYQGVATSTVTSASETSPLFMAYWVSP